MTNYELEKRTKQNQQILKELLKEKEELENTSSKVQRYIRTQKLIQEQSEKQEFLNQLELGFDGTIFQKYQEPHTKTFSTHFGLSCVLEYAFDLMKQEMNTSEKDTTYYQISFQNLLDYIENAKKILNNMNHVEGDRQIENPFGLDIYQNPKNYSIVDFQSLIPMNNEQLHSKYDANDIIIQNDCFITNNPHSVNIKFTPREYEAFYGESSKKALGFIPKKSKEKIKKNTRM